MSGRIGAAGAALLTSLLVGCSGQDPPPSEPPPLTSGTTTSSAPASISPTPPSSTTEPSGAPVLPDAAKAHTPAGAEAFVRYWYDTLQYSWDVMDSAPIQTLGDCLSCNNIADTIDTVAADGNRLEGGEIRIRAVDGQTSSDQTTATVDSLVSSAEQRIVAPDGTSKVLGEAKPQLEFFFDLAWTRGPAWVVTAIRIVEQ